MNQNMPVMAHAPAGGSDYASDVGQPGYLCECISAGKVKRSCWSGRITVCPQSLLESRLLGPGAPRSGPFLCGRNAAVSSC